MQARQLIFQNWHLKPFRQETMHGEKNLERNTKLLHVHYL